MVAYPDRGEGNDPEPFFFFLGGGGGGGSLSQPRLNIFTVGNMRVMICLGQGGLRSLSASSYSFICTKGIPPFLHHNARMAKKKLYNCFLVLNTQDMKFANS